MNSRQLVIYIALATALIFLNAIFFSEQALPSANFDSSLLRKDADLEGLVSLLNTRPDIFQYWDYDDKGTFLKHYVFFMQALTPWLIAPPAVDVPTQFSHNLSVINCSNPSFRHALSGKHLTSPRLIVDFIPFGYELDKLEIRLLENFFVVDAFVIFESTLTQTGLSKPLLFDRVKDSPRFSRFREKVIHLTATSQEMLGLLPSHWRFDPKDFRMENAMRIMMMKKFREMSSGHPQYSLYQRLTSPLSPHLHDTIDGNKVSKRTMERYMSNISDILTAAPLAIQGDGDEMVLSLTLLHLKHCELKQPSFPIYAPAFSYKHNIHTLQKEQYLHLLLNEDLPAAGTENVPGNGEQHGHRHEDTASVFLDYLCDVGPMVDTLMSFMATNSTQRVRRIQLDVHLGIGAAMHLSSVQEPAEIWVKAGSTHHGLENSDMYKVVTRRFIAKGRRSEITANDIWKAVHVAKKEEKTKSNLQNMHSSASSCVRADSSSPKDITTTSDGRLRPVYLFRKYAQELLLASLPVVLKISPERYPFISPLSLRRCAFSS